MSKFIAVTIIFISILITILCTIPTTQFLVIDSAAAEQLVVKLKGIYPVDKAWIASVNHDAMEIFAASAVVHESSTVITAESPDGPPAALTAILVTGDNQVIAPIISDSDSITHQILSAGSELGMLEQKIEILTNSSQQLTDEINLERVKIGAGR